MSSSWSSRQRGVVERRPKLREEDSVDTMQYLMFSVTREMSGDEIERLHTPKGTAGKWTFRRTAS